MAKATGRITMPAEAGGEELTARLARQWGADAIRDSDGTRLSEALLSLGYEVYSTLCLIRENQTYARMHLDQLQCLYLRSRPVTARGPDIVIDPLDGYFREQLIIDPFSQPSEWWEVRDGTSDTVVEPGSWRYDAATGTVHVWGCVSWHRYTVSFLARQIWEPVSMYNHLTNGWVEEHRSPLDPRHAAARARLLAMLDEWLAAHPRTAVVRFTTFAYNFDLIYDEKGKELQVDWFGYLSCVSPEALLAFEQEKGYRLGPEDFIDAGYYNSPFRNPSARYRDWMEFQNRFVVSFARECVQHVHAAGKKAIMFLGDQWIGTEPYGKLFPSIDLDGVVGSVGDGVTLRMIADIPTRMREGRFLPYFFPDVFRSGGEPSREFMIVWNKARRALLHAPLDRMGFGGYLSLAARFPEFVDRAAWACDEFRELWARAGGAPSWKPPFAVAFLNAWGSLRSWQCWQVTHSTWNQRAYSYLGLLEAARACIK